MESWGRGGAGPKSAFRIFARPSNIFSYEQPPPE